MNSSLFRLSFFINNEQTQPNLNGVFVNKYGKIQCWLRNFDYFWEILNRLLSLLKIFIYNQKNVSAFGFWFQLLWKSSKLPSIFLGFQSIRSVKWILIMNSKKALFATQTLQFELKKVLWNCLMVAWNISVFVKDNLAA